jgi:hypothetical protein
VNFSSGVDSNNYYYFTIADIESNNSYNTSTFQGPILERPNITITHIQGNETYVNITTDSSQYSLLILRVNDTDNNTAPIPMNLTVYVQENATEWDSGLVNQTNASGFMNYYFAPDCNYSPGVNKWYANSTDYYYQQLLTDNMSIRLNGTLTNYVTYPFGIEFLRGSNITIQVRVNDTCGNNITDANVSVTLWSEKNNQNFVCPGISHVGNGLYNCTFNTSENPGVMPAKGYNITVYSNRTYYNSDNMTVGYAEGATSFWIETAPILYGAYNLTSDPVRPGGWGEEWTFYINLTNEDNDQVDLFLLLRNNISGSWSDWDLYNNDNEDNPTVQDVTDNDSQQSFTISIFAEEFQKTSRGLWQFKWNATEDDSYIDETSALDFNVTDDDVGFVYSKGNNSVINRSNSTDSAILEVRVNDTDNGGWLAAGFGRFYVTTNEDTAAITEADYQWQVDVADVGVVGDGNISDTFPSQTRCTYSIGPQKWKAEFYFDGYFTTNSSLFNINLTTVPLDVNIQLPVTNTTMRKNQDNIVMRGNVTDDCASVGPLANATVDFTVQERDYSCVSVNNEENGWYNCTIASSIPESQSWQYLYYNITMQANKSYYNGSSTKIKKDAFILVSNPKVSGISISTAPLDTGNGLADYGWGENWSVSASIQDDDQRSTDYSDQLNVSLYVNVSGGWKMIDSQLRSDLQDGSTVTLSYHNFTCSDIGPRIFVINITDVFNYTNTTNTSQSIGKNTVYVQFTSDPATLNREGEETGEYRVRVKDADNNTWVNSSVNTSFWFGYDNSLTNYDSGQLNLTDYDGYSEYNFNATCSYSVGTGLHYWKAGVLNDGCYADRNFTIPSTEYNYFLYGQLKNWVMRPTYQQNFNVTDQIVIEYNVTSECLGISAENPLTSATTNFTLQSPNSSWEGPITPNDYSGIYNYTWDSTDRNEGNWTILLNSSLQYYNANWSLLTQWFWLENVEPQNQTPPAVSPTQDGWSVLFNYTIQIADQDRQPG